MDQSKKWGEDQNPVLLRIESELQGVKERMGIKMEATIID